MRSIINQGYPNLELIVVDAGSTDGTMDVLRQLEPHIANLICEPDRGQSDAINKALRLATGAVVGWQNSDDVYFPGALFAVAKALDAHPRAAMVSGLVACVDASDNVLSVGKYVRPTRRRLLYEGYVMSSQGVFWRRDIHDEVGYFDVQLHQAMDADFWLRVLARYQACFIPTLVGGFRVYPGTKTSERGADGTAEYEGVVRRHRVNPRSLRYRLVREMLRSDRLLRWSVSPAWTLAGQDLGGSIP